MVQAPARNVTRGGGAYTCLWTPCKECKHKHCPLYQCAFRECSAFETRFTPRDAQGCPMCPTCKPRKNLLDLYDKVEDEKDDM